ncbi:MAG: transposase [bacterium]
MKGKQCGKRQGKKQAKGHYFYGYKAHTSMSAESNIITSLVVTSGNANDGK